MLQLSIFMSKLLILMFWLRYLYSCSKKQPLLAIKLEEVSRQCLRNESYQWCRLHHDCKPIAKNSNVLGLQYFVGNDGIQNIFARTRYQVVLQNDHFADNTKQDKTDKGDKIRIIDHLNESFQAVFSNKSEQCIDEYMTKFKERSCFLS